MAHRYEKASNIWLVAHTLMPSAASVIGGVIFTLMVVGLHLLFLSQDPDLLLPYFAGQVNDQLAQIYASSVLAPIDAAFDNSLLSTVTTALLWGFVGWAIYAVFDWIISTRRDLKSGQNQISIPQKGQVIYHPLRNQVVIRLLWRFFIGLVLIGGTIASLSFFGNLLKHDVLFLQANDPMEMLKQIGIVTVGWLVVFHIYTVLFRLFVLRTRVFGEILY